MENQPLKQSNNQISRIPLTLLQKESIKGIQSLDFKSYSELLPKKIEDSFDEPKVFESIMVVGRDRVQSQIEFELINLSRLVSVGGNLTAAQQEFFASELIDLYPSETLADFTICFKMAARGDFGDIYRLDGIVIRQWMEAYLEIKYQKLEKSQSQAHIDHQKNQDEIVSKILERTDKDTLNEPSITKTDRVNTLREKLAGFTEKEIEEEGQEIPKRKYIPPSKDYIDIHEKKIKWARENTDLQFGTIIPNHPNFEDWLKINENKL